MFYKPPVLVSIFIILILSVSLCLSLCQSKPNPSIPVFTLMCDFMWLHSHTGSDLSLWSTTRKWGKGAAVTQISVTMQHQNTENNSALYRLIMQRGEATANQTADVFIICSSSVNGHWPTNRQMEQKLIVAVSTSVFKHDRLLYRETSSSKINIPAGLNRWSYMMRTVSILLNKININVITNKSNITMRTTWYFYVFTFL